MHRALILSSLLIPLSSAGCGGDDAITGPDAAVVVDAGLSSEDAALQGGWMFSTCGTTKFSRTLTVTAQMMVWNTSWFRPSDTTCGAAYAVLNVNETYTAGAPASVGLGVREIDIKSVGTSLVPKDATVVAYWNDIAYCGYSDWTLNVAKDIANRICTAGSDVEEYWPVDHIQYTIYRADPARLYFGDSATGTATSDGTRPTQLETGFYMKI